jgi:hypothetical protein
MLEAAITVGDLRNWSNLGSTVTRNKLCTGMGNRVHDRPTRSKEKTGFKNEKILDEILDPGISAP